MSVAFPPRIAVRCSVSMATQLMQSPHGEGRQTAGEGLGILLVGCVFGWECVAENETQSQAEG